MADRNKPFDSPRRDLRPETIRRECEASLRRLGVDRIDLYQFHWPDELGTPVEDSWGEMKRLIEEGKCAPEAFRILRCRCWIAANACGTSILSSRLFP
jgi:aryl-alcohol dehydrogenase-like predicted oxidoreductase